MHSKIASHLLILGFDFVLMFLYLANFKLMVIYNIYNFRLSARIAAEVSLWLCDLFQFSEGAAYCHDDTREGKYIYPIVLSLILHII